MKTRTNKNKIWIMMSILCLGLALAGCDKKGADAYGKEISQRSITKLNEVLAQPGNYDGKTVTVEGKIVQVCPAGCWFDVKEDTAMIHVDIKPSGFAIPQERGSSVVVEGKISMRNNQPVLIGTGVEIK